MNEHKWKIGNVCISTGKIEYICPRCGLIDQYPPSKDKEMRPCDPEKYRDLFYSEERHGDLYEETS